VKVKTFHGVRESADGTFDGGTSDVAIVGAPIDLGASERPGARFGPDAIRTAPYLSGQVHHMTFDVPVFGALSVVDTGDSEVAIGSFEGSIDLLRGKTRKVAQNTRCLVTLGGDNSVVLPSLEAVAAEHGPVALVHFDAHTDTWGSDFPGLTHATVLRRAIEQGIVRYGHQLGIRGYTHSHQLLQWGRENGLTCWSMDDIDTLGIREVISSVLIQTEGPVYLTIDIDVLDPAYAPGTGTPEPGGLTSRELLAAVRAFTRNLDVVGFDVVEVSPPYDCADTTAIIANRCVHEMLAAKAHRMAHQS
jgi:agmatinase